MQSGRICCAFALLWGSFLVPASLETRAWSQEPVAPLPQEKIVSTIRNRGYKTVGVIPQAIVRRLETDADGKTRLVTKNSTGALSRAWSNEFYDELFSASAEPGSGFQVVSEQKFLTALSGQKLEDVGSDELWDLIAKKTGVDAVLVPSVIDPGPSDGGRVGATELSMGLEIHDVKGKFTVGHQSLEYRKSLSDAAYAGESFIVREYVNGQLGPSGLRGGNYFGMGLLAEREQYEQLQSGPHPLTLEKFPYTISVVVNGKVRRPVEIDGALYVPLSIGEKYQLHVTNRDEHPVFAAIYIDGLNTIGQKRERPDSTDTNRTWWFRPTGNEARVIEGWFQHDSSGTNRPQVDEFVVTAASDSLAATTAEPGGETFGSSLGLITAIFYTYGTEGIPVTRAPKPPPESSIGTGRGARIDSRVASYDTQKKLKGLMLAAVTLYYRTPEQIAQLAREAGGSDVVQTTQSAQVTSLDVRERPTEAVVTPEELERLPPLPPEQSKSTGKRATGNRLAPGSGRPK